MFTMTPEVEAVLSRAAELRAEGSGWPASADELDYAADDLKQLCKEAGKLYDRMYSKAQRQVIREGLAESMFQMRRLLRVGDNREIRHAADSLARISMTMIRHRRRAKSTAKKPQEIDPRLAKMKDEDVEFLLWLTEQSDADLEARAKRFPQEEVDAIIEREKQKNREKDQGNGDAGGNPVPRTPHDPSQPTTGRGDHPVSPESAGPARETPSATPEPRHHGSEAKNNPCDSDLSVEQSQRVSFGSNRSRTAPQRLRSTERQHCVRTLQMKSVKSSTHSATNIFQSPRRGTSRNHRLNVAIGSRIRYNLPSTLAVLPSRRFDMPSESVAGFLDRAQASRVLFPEQVQQLITQPDFPESDLNVFCEYLQSRGVLTQFQASALREHRGHELSYGGYPIIDEIGPCPGGTAYRALHPSLRTPIVLRRLRGDWFSPIDNPTNYLARARAFGMLSHPNLVPLLDAGMQGDQLYLVIDPAPDSADLETLSKEIGGAMPGFLAAEYGRSIASALRPAHEHGGTHGDIRPSNLVIGPLNVKTNAQGKQRRRPAPDAVVRLAELGLVPMRPPASAYPTGVSPYLPPERLDSPTQDARGDLYSLGGSLYFLLTGRPPFTGEDQELVNKIRSNSPPPLATLRPDLPPDFVALISKLLEKDPAKRPQSAHEVEIALNKFCRQVTAPSSPKMAPLASPASVVGYSNPAAANGHPELVAVPMDEVATEHSDEWGVSPNEFEQAQSGPAEPRKVRVMSAEEKGRSKMLLLLGGMLHITAVTMLVLWLTGVFDGSSDPEPEPTKPTKKAPDGGKPKKKA
ncbi:MAG: hypothetical protein C0467_14335 [Planctomycetaceae bacterium]|nr:hypothetical protein [Planctomycetaceae bacterium]